MAKLVNMVSEGDEWKKTKEIKGKLYWTEIGSILIFLGAHNQYVSGQNLFSKIFLFFLYWVSSEAQGKGKLKIFRRLLGFFK